MEDQAYIGGLVSGLLYLTAGARLLRLALRTGERPERLLGAMFLVTGASYIVYTIPQLTGLESLWTAASFTGRVLYLPAPVMLAVFTRQVFRREDPWAIWLVYGTPALLVAGVAGSALGGDWEGYSIGNPWFWLEWVGYTVPFGWAGVEAFTQYRRSRRRLRIGLSEPLACNRLVLWSFFGAIQVAASLMLIPQYMAYEQQDVFTAIWDALIGASESFSIVLIWLVFFPPAVYRRWITAAAPAARSESAHGNL